MATASVTLRPVDSRGQPVSGYRVTTESFDGFGCGDASPVAVSAGIRFCGPSATNTVACWKSAVPSTVLCLRDPFVRTLVRITYVGTFAPVAAPARPAPQGLALAGGVRCQIRDGGAWSSVPQHPDWVGSYFCTDGSAVYGPQAGNGINHNSPTWTVETVAPTGQGPITKRRVTSAYYVGTA